MPPPLEDESKCEAKIVRGPVPCFKTTMFVRINTKLKKMAHLEHWYTNIYIHIRVYVA